MPVKRSLKLDDQFEENSFSPSKTRRKKSMTAYSPTTGTYQMSPFSSPSTPKEHERGKGPSNGKKKLNNLSSPTSKESTAKDSDEFMVLLSKIERSSEKTMEIMKKLSSIQALANNRQLEDLIGISLVPCFLKREVEKTRELMTEVTKQRLLEKKSSRNPPRDSGPNQLCTLLNMEWIPSSSSPHSFAHLFPSLSTTCSCCCSKNDTQD